MSQPFIGEITIFSGTFAPKDWAFCNGQIMAISSNEELFSLIGTTYGGDGRTTFGLPELRGRIPVHQGQGSGLTVRQMGQRYGAENVTLTVDQIPPHTHNMMASTSPAQASNPGQMVPAETQDNMYIGGTIDPSKVFPLDPRSVLSAGQTDDHTNMMPYLGVNFIISLKGIYPSRN